ncbi:ATP-binding protein [Melittangium boletus]|uniref:ATP-binding protein n=1 Tax=Melittangium boletus TaxID=83453 RepID=UPI003DA317DC
MTELDKVLGGGGETGAILRARDWSRTALGPVETWPPALRSAVGLMLASPTPTAFFWGPELVVLYNDGMLPIYGAKHPGGLGVPAREVFAELWDALHPLFDGVMRTGRAVYQENQPYFMNRQGFVEEAYFTFAYTPLRDEHGQVVGVFDFVTETTRQVLGERRFKTLRELSIRVASAQSLRAVLLGAQEVLERGGADVPFALLHRAEASGPQLLLRAGLTAEALDAVAASPWPLGDVLRSGEVRQVTLPEGLRAGPWPEPVRAALLLPLTLEGDVPDAVLAVGLSPRLPLDEAARDFLQLLASQLAADAVRALAHEQEKQRAEALAALDRAKTAFFSNVSHEFRTPLTLLLGPTENALASPERALGGVELKRVHRNALRLLKLVNTLLDFSRLGATSAVPRQEPTELAALTSGLAGAFDSVMATAGLRLVVDCPPLSGPVWVDPDMWEKVVLNLVSNAFKFTLQGEIAVSLREREGGVELSVRDTGTGIPAQELTRIFERFHRVRDARGRSDEGSGIGLSLVRELARVQGGDVTVESVPGEGSTFRVWLPTGRPAAASERGAPQHRPPARGPAAFVHEAEQWLAHVPEAPASPRAEATHGHVLLADDNADMREYMARLLSSHFTVEAVADGQAALDAARARTPDAVVSDVMMPGLDGFALVRALRADPRTAPVPILLVSARAGEVATVEGLQSGVDDYLAKPFGARELLARVGILVRASQARAERERLLEQLRQVLEASGTGLWEFEPDTRSVRVDARMSALLGLPAGAPSTLDEALARVDPEQREQVLQAISASLSDTRAGVFFSVFRVLVPDAPAPRWLECRGQRLRDARGRTVLAGVVLDITARKQTETELRTRADFEQQLIGIVSHDLRNPLSAILLGTTALTRREVLDERATRALLRIQSSAERATRMVKDLLDFTQARLGGGIPIVPRTVDLHEVTRGVLEEVEAAHPTRHLEVRHEGEGRGEWDPDRLAQVVQNLVVNALKYSPEDSVVRVRTLAEDGGVSLSVANQGEPIPEHLRVRLFEPMQRGTAEVDKQGRSVGLGLYIVRSIVEAHGGRITVSSSKDEGTVFTVHLPRRR